MISEEIAVLDFETTGLSTETDRPTEIAVAIWRDGAVVDEFQSLMNPGRPIPAFVQSLTGITDAMVATAPAVGTVMREAAKFVGSRGLIAHNASFDRRFWCAELSRLGMNTHPAFACTLLLARRLYPQSPDHKLGTLAKLLHLQYSGRAHRAMVDVLVTSKLLARMHDDLRSQFRLPHIDHQLLQRIQAASKSAVPGLLASLRLNPPPPA